MTVYSLEMTTVPFFFRTEDLLQKLMRLRIHRLPSRLHLPRRLLHRLPSRHPHLHPSLHHLFRLQPNHLFSQQLLPFFLVCGTIVVVHVSMLKQLVHPHSIQWKTAVLVKVHQAGERKIRVVTVQGHVLHLQHLLLFSLRRSHLFSWHPSRQTNRRYRQFSLRRNLLSRHLIQLLQSWQLTSQHPKWVSLWKKFLIVWCWTHELESLIKSSLNVCFELTPADELSNLSSSNHPTHFCVTEEF